MDYHVLDADQAGNAVRVVFHIPVPDVVNLAGVSYRTAVMEWQGGPAAIDTVLFSIDSAELTALKAGELVERVVEFKSNPGATLAEKRGALEVQYNNTRTAVQLVLERRLAVWGYANDVP